ncbi:MAG TPA: dihydrodipicolinate synthase family protein [Geminicoccaceae bacterium]|nr:dihydrodipicolinate synthase family protein [Geminicoccaceae bacterium]
MQIEWNGVLFIAATQFLPDESLGLEATQRNVETLIAAGAGGIVVLGRFGEIMSLTRVERRRVVEATKEVVRGRVPLLSGCIETSPHDAFAYAREMERLGVDGLMATPLLGYPPKREEAVHYFRLLARASGLPIMIYNEPTGYGVDLTPDLLLQLAEQPTVVAIKESTEKTNRVTDILRACGDRFRIFCGADQIILESMLVGCHGWVCALGNPFPEEAVRLVQLAQAERYVEARALARWMQPVLNLDARPTFVQCGKLAMQVTGHGAEMVRTPLLPLTGAEREEVIGVTEQVLAARPALR